MKKILFIGGAGFIGSNLIRVLIKDDYDIHVCEPANASLHRLQGLDLKIHNCSLTDTPLVSDIIKQNNIGIVVHLVSSLIPGSTYEDYKEEFKHVIFPSIELMEICAEIGVKFSSFYRKRPNGSHLILRMVKADDGE